MRKLKINIILVSTALLMLGFSCSETGKEEMEKRKKMEWKKTDEGFPVCAEDNTFVTIAKIKKLGDDCYVFMVFRVNENSQIKKGSQIEKTILIPAVPIPNEFKKDGLKVYIEYCKEFLDFSMLRHCVGTDWGYWGLKDYREINTIKIKEL